MDAEVKVEGHLAAVAVPEMAPRRAVAPPAAALPAAAPRAAAPVPAKLAAAVVPGVVPRTSILLPLIAYRGYIPSVNQSASGSGRTGSSSSTGGATKSGSGPAPRFGGGSYYAGGARQPYSSGSLSPSGIRPLFIGAGLGALVFYPHGAWPNGAYFYPYSQPYHFYNASSGRDESEPVKCACEPNVECGCDDPGGANTTTVLNELIGNGSYAALDKTEVMVANNTILINGTLPNGTTASGGENAGAGMRFMLQNSGWWPVVATVCAAVFIA